MPRTARPLADNQIYHIINRGNGWESVFHDNYDYEKFLKLLIESKEIYAYCLMPNHFNLVIYKFRWKNIDIKNIRNCIK